MSHFYFIFCYNLQIVLLSILYYTYIYNCKVTQYFCNKCITARKMLDKEQIYMVL